MTPFLAYTYRIVPILSETAVVRPWKYFKYAALGYGLNKLGDIVGGGDEKTERALMQEKQKGRFMVDFMPYRKIKLPVVISFLKALPICPITKGNFCLDVVCALIKFTNIP